MERSQDELASIFKAINKSQAVIEFNLDGSIITANDNFLNVLGYSLSEIQGKHHSIFVDPQYAKSHEYKSFWQNLGKGQFDTGEYKRITKGGHEIWVQASYNPIFDMNGKPFKVVKFASDVTAQKLESADSQGQLEAISKSQAVIEFNLDGTILTANDNFLNAVGYSLSEIQSKHHSMFVDPQYAKSNEYKSFWQNLGNGIYDSGEYKRIAKGGREIWIQASYNPIFDMNGKPFKVVKFASDVTARKLDSADSQGQLEAISKSQAVIEFNLDGTILTANDNFLNAVGYSLSEIQGKHHSMFVDPQYAKSNEYKSFWQNLGNGIYDSGEYKRIAKGGREVWIQASYNPIFDMNGKPFKVVKFASDITLDKIRQHQETQDMETYQQEISKLVEACQKGQLTERGNVDVLSGSWKTVMAGINEIIDVIVSPINEVSAVLEQVAQGDLTGQITTEYYGDHAIMKDAINGTLVSLNKIMLQLKDISINLNSEINTLENSSRDLVSITTQQAAALEEITYSIQETNEQVKKSVTTTEETKVLANDSMSQVGNSSSSMEILMAAMDEISKSSEEISGVIKVIDDIAFQTNLLALNAAVEAARAGEHGKGFAVVATEVQNLASKSSEAAKSTASMIAHAINKVTEGVNISNQTSDSLAVISNKATEINELVNDVFTSNASQSTAINQISVAVNEVNIGVSQCSTNTQSLTQVAHALKNFSHQLSDSMSQFKLNEQKQPSQDCANLPFDLPPNVTVEDLLALINQK